MQLALQAPLKAIPHRVKRRLFGPRQLLFGKPGDVRAMEVDVQSLHRHSDGMDVIQLHLAVGRDCVSFQVAPEWARDFATEIIRQCDGFEARRAASFTDENQDPSLGSREVAG